MKIYTKLIFRDVVSTITVGIQSFAKDDMYAIPQRNDILDINNVFYKVKLVQYHYRLINKVISNNTTQEITIYIEQLEINEIDF